MKYLFAILFLLCMATLTSCQKEDGPQLTSHDLIMGTWFLRSQKFEAFDASNTKIFEKVESGDIVQIKIDERLMDYTFINTKPRRVDTYQINSKYNPFGYGTALVTYQGSSFKILYDVTRLDLTHMTWVLDLGQAPYTDNRGIPQKPNASRRIYEFSK